VSGAVQWGTKSFEFWTLLMVILAVERPKSIVEFGSGRSTSYLAEYAMKQGIPYASIEQNPVYARSVKRGLSNSFLDPRYLHHIPIAEDGWYEAEPLNRVVTAACELLFIDGPVGAQESIGKGVRSCERSDRWLAAAAATSTVLIVDDVHRRPNLEMFHALMSPLQHLRPMFLSYHVQRIPNVLAIGIPSSSYDRIANICSEIKIAFFTEYSMEECSDGMAQSDLGDQAE
jgi:predicted O-methyltransferase YrrM